MADNSYGLSPEDEMTIRLLKSKPFGPSTGSFDPSLSAGNVSPSELFSANEMAAARNKTRGGGEGYRGDYTPEERQQQQYNAAKAMSLIPSAAALGPAGIASALIGGGMSGGASIMAGKPEEAATEAISSMIPYGLGKLGRAAPYALGAYGATNVMQPSAISQEKDENPFKWDNNAYLQRQKAAQKSASQLGPRGAAKLMQDFEAREGEERKGIEQKALDWENARQNKISSSNALDAYKQRVAPSAKLLKPEVQQQIQNAGSVEEASKLYYDAMNERINLSKTSYEKYGPDIESAALASGLLGGAFGYKIPASRAKALTNATNEASGAFDAAMAAKTPQNKAALLKAKNMLEGRAGVSPHPTVGQTLRFMAFPDLVGTVGPNAFDSLVSPYPEVREKGMNNFIPGWSRSSPDAPWYDRDWTTALQNHLRSAGEGVATHAFGGGLGQGVRDFAAAKQDADSMLKTIKEGAKVRGGAKTPRKVTAKSKQVPSPNEGSQ